MNQQEVINYWEKRAQEVADKNLVTHNDYYQKLIELDFIGKYLDESMDVLEVGCGNGFVSKFISERVKSLDGFDPSVSMIALAENDVDAGNCSFFVKALPQPEEKGLKEVYDCILAVRVLINVAGCEGQKAALSWIASKLKKGGAFIMLEGFEEGLRSVNQLRSEIGMAEIPTAKFNLNLTDEVYQYGLENYFIEHEVRDIGLYDFITRIFYPAYVGDGKIEYNTEFHKLAYEMTKILNEKDILSDYSRMKMCVLKKK